jgi:hypothetical protein
MNEVVQMTIYANASQSKYAISQKNNYQNEEVQLKTFGMHPQQ